MTQGGRRLPGYNVIIRFQKKESAQRMAQRVREKFLGYYINVEYEGEGRAVLQVQDLIDLIRQANPVMIARWIHQKTHEEAFEDLADQLQQIADVWQQPEELPEITVFDFDLAKSLRVHLMDVEGPEDYLPPKE